MPFECPVPIEDYETVTLAHGGGGKLTNRLIETLLVPALDNDVLRQLHDGAIVPSPGARLAFSTDGFVVRPPFFPGGDIGSLAVHGTVNDLAMCGARPRYLSLGFILEEGFPLRDLWRVVVSVREASDAAGVRIVAGDTKVVERGHGDGIYVHTTGLGEIVEGAEIAPSRAAPGDVVIVNGPIGDHGIAILSQREGFRFEAPDLVSDSAALWPVVERLIAACGPRVHVLRDATRGGVASVVNEIAAAARVGIVLVEGDIPVRESVRGGCEVLGLDPLYVANEGKFLAFVDPEASDAALAAIRAHPLGAGARAIGRVVDAHPGVVRLRSGFGGSRVVDMVSGEQLPRIC